MKSEVMGALRHPPPHSLSLQHLPGAIVCIHKHQPSKLTGYALREGMNKAGNLTASSCFFRWRFGQCREKKAVWESTVATTFSLTANLSLLSQGSSPVTRGGGGRRR